VNPDHPSDTVTPTCQTGLEPGCSTTLTVGGFETTKTVTPSGVAHRGDVVTYRITSTNTGDAPANPGISDDLTDVLDDATLNPGPWVATIDGLPAGAATILDNLLTWNGTVQPGKTVIITYSVTVKDDAVIGDQLKNGVRSVDCDPAFGPLPDRCITPPVTVSGLSVNKVSSPANGSQIAGSQTLTYTVTAKNVHPTKAMDVTLTDDLTNVLENAKFNATGANAPTATIDGQTATAPTWDSSSKTLTWHDSLPALATVTVTYSVVTNLDVTTDDVMRNGVIGSAPDPDRPGQPADSTCVTGEEAGCYSVVTGNETPTPRTPQFNVSKSSDPSGTVRAGQIVTYTLTGANTGIDDIPSVTVTDDMSRVLPYADLDMSSLSAKIGTQTVNPPTEVGTNMVWTGSVAAGETVTITYKVTVHDDADTGTRLVNEVSSSVAPPCDPNVDPACHNEVIVDNPGLAISKVSDPVTGSTVYSGQTVTYTLTAENKGLDAIDATLNDDLSGVLNYATLNQSTITNKIDGQTAGSVAVSAGNVLTWTGSIPAGKTVTVVYSVVLDSDLSSATLLRNAVTGHGTNPDKPDEDIPSTCVAGTDPGCSSSLTPKDVAFTVSKVSDPVSGSAVSRGQTITYTITGVNTSGGTIDAQLTDDLTGIMNNATYDLGASVTINGQTVPNAPTLTGNILSWSGPLTANQTVVMRYQVTVTQNAVVNQNLRNSVKSTATTPDRPDIPLPTTCETGDEPGCSSTVTVGEAKIQLNKASTPPSGMTVYPGQTVTYMLTAQASTLALDQVTLTDNLSDVLDNADFVSSSLTAKIGSVDQNAPTLSSTNILTWTGSIPANQTLTISYQVVVKMDADSTTLYNKLTGTAVDHNNPSVPATSNCILGSETGCYSNLPVGIGPHPNLDVSKTSTPPTGSVVRAGQVITYTLVGKNIGNRDLNPVTLTDDLTSVANHATLVPGSLQATVDGNPVNAPSITNSVLTWSGPLTINQQVTVTYQYKVNRDITKNDTLTNSVTGTGVNPENPDQDVPSTCESNPPAEGCSSVLTGGEGYLSVTKTSDPASGSKARSGQTITYTLTASNTGNAPVDNVELRDDLSGVLGSATLVPDSLNATPTDDGTVTAPQIVGQVVTWDGSLAAGQTVTVTYQVVVNKDVTIKDQIVNKVIGSGSNPEIPDNPVPSTCVTGEEPGCSSIITPEVSKFDIKKTSSVPSAGPGQTITYTITGVNSGNVNLNPATLSDNLTDVLKYGTVVPGSVQATIDGAAASVAPALSNSVVTWSGPLDAGKTVVLSYQVIVNKNVTTTATVVNRVTGSGTNPDNPGGPNPSSCQTGQEPGCFVPVVIGSVKVGTGGTAVHNWTPMETLPLMGVIAGLLVGYITRRQITVKH